MCVMTFALLMVASSDVVGSKALEFDVLLKASDDALYLSKTNGRNRITFGEVNVTGELFAM